MAKSPFKTDDFKAEFEHWNKILEKSGFKDAEDFSRDEPRLKQSGDKSTKKSRGLTRDTIDQKLKYYLWAESMVDSFAFISEVHKIIWKMHAEGKSLRHIEKAVNLKNFRKSNIFLLLRKIKKEMIWTTAYELLDEPQN